MKGHTEKEEPLLFAVKRFVVEVADVAEAFASAEDTEKEGEEVGEEEAFDLHFPLDFDCTLTREGLADANRIEVVT